MDIPDDVKKRVKKAGGDDDESLPPARIIHKADPSEKPPIVATRHPGLIALYRERGLIPDNAEYINTGRVRVEDVRGRDVVGILPLYIACECRTFTTVPIDNSKLTFHERGTDLPLGRLREVALPTVSYAIQRIDVPESIKQRKEKKMEARVVKAVIIDKPSEDLAPLVLLLQKKDTQEFDLPGGFLEPEDRGSDSGALRREAIEEIGVDIQVLKKIADWSDTADQKPLTGSTYVAALSASKSNIKLGEEHSSHTWVTKEIVENLHLLPTRIREQILTALKLQETEDS